MYPDFPSPGPAGSGGERNREGRGAPHSHTALGLRPPAVSGESH